MSSPDRAVLLKTGVRFPSPGAVKTFVAELENNWPGGPAGPLGSQDTFTVNTLMIGTNLRIRGTPNGGVLEILGTDNNWHSELSWSNTKPTGT